MTASLLALLIPLALGGCAGPAPRAILLPTTAAVRAPLALATTGAARAAASNARAIALAKTALASGIVAGSREARELSTFTLDTGADLTAIRLQLATANVAIDKLTEQLLAKQKLVDAQTARLAYLEPKYAAAVKIIWWYRVRFWGPIVFALLAVGVIVAARFTAWGARTLGPVLVGAEHVAVKAAVLA